MLKRRQSRKFIAMMQQTEFDSIIIPMETLQVRTQEYLAADPEKGSARIIS